MDQLLDESSTEMSPEMADMLPEEIRQMIELQKEKKAQQVESLGRAVAKKRDAAVDGRAASGIESDWAEDEESYLGIDDANRTEQQAYKPGAPNASFVPRGKSASRSTVFLNITRPYCDAASARVADMLLPTDDRNWAIKPSPIPSTQNLKDDPTPINPAVLGPAKPGAQPEAPTVGALAKRAIAAAVESANKAQERIDDWLVESHWHAEVRKIIEDAAKLGTCIMKGPVPVKRKYKAVKNGELVMEVSIAPESKRVDPWNFYPDPACGESIHNGSYVFEKDEITARRLKDLKGTPGYLADQIDKIIDEGPGKKHEMSGRLGQKTSVDDDKFEIWYYYGLVDREDLEAMGVEVDETTLDGVPAIVTLVNDTAIKAVLNPLDSGDFPYDVMPWQRKSGSWAGVGVARQIRTPQRMLNAATRNMMDNAGISAGPQIVVWRNKVIPADGNWEITPRKIWFAKEDADIQGGVQNAFASFAIDSRQAELNNIIMFALKMAEDVTGLPMLIQGQQGKAPETVGGMQMLQNNASGVLRRLARNFDDFITEPHIRRYYDWLMMYGEDEDEKGDFVIDARGSSALVERDLQNQAILQMGGMVMNPAFGIDPEKWFEEACKAQRLDPKRFMMDEAKKEEMAKRPPPMPPQVMAAQIRAQSDAQKTQALIQADMEQTKIEAQVDMARIQKDTDRDTVYVQSEMQRANADYQARMAELQVKRELEMLKYANQNQITLDEIKAGLAKETMRLQTQKELAALDHTARQVAQPAIEPPGRAQNGQAFQG